MEQWDKAYAQPSQSTSTASANKFQGILGAPASPGAETNSFLPDRISGKPTPEYDPNQPVYAGPDVRFQDATPQKTGTVIPEGANFRDSVMDVYQQNSPEVQAARNSALERLGGQGLLFSDMAMRGGEGAAMDKSMALAAPDVQFQQDLTKSEQDFNEAGGLANQAGNIALQQIRASGQVQGALNAQQQALDAKTKTMLQALDAKTKTMLQGFQKENQQIANNFTREMQELGFSQQMQSTLLQTVQGMINSGNTFLTSLATSPDATKEEVDALRQSIINGLTTYTNIWKESAGSTDTFDFTGIGG